MPMKELKLFGMRMKELRTAKNLSQEQLAEKSAISPKYMSRIEMGLHFPSFDIITKLANALQVEVKDFFEFAHEAKNTRELKEIISGLLKGADDERLRLAVKVLRALMR
jgi:transcriptional regulator with XRE-family HTH domain